MTAHDLQPCIFLHNYYPYLFHLFFPQNGLKVNKAISFHFFFVFGGFLYFLTEFLSLFFVFCFSLPFKHRNVWSGLLRWKNPYFIFLTQPNLLKRWSSETENTYKEPFFLSFFLSCKRHSFLILHHFFSIHLYTHTYIDSNNIITACLFLSILIF